ncbi:DNA repair protein [Yarrowia sp. B02]|nr:DNA repair protein [Yarrowia sp. B02]
MGKRSVDASVHLDMLREYQKKRKVEKPAQETQTGQMTQTGLRHKRVANETQTRESPATQTPSKAVKKPSLQSQTFDLDGESSEEEDWEEVDIDKADNSAQPLSISFEPGSVQTDTEPVNRLGYDTKGSLTKAKKKTAKKPTLSREERQRRITVHQIHVLALIKHVSIRNAWANDLLLQMQLRETVPSSKLSGLKPDMSKPKMVRTSKFYETLKYLLQQWAKVWYTDSRGLHKRDFNELNDINAESYDPPVTKGVFNKKVIRHRGSRDLKVQGFVALLRAVGLDARLVVSLQPLDFASNAKVEDEATEKKEKTTQTALRKPKFTAGQSKSAQKSQARMHYSESPSPVFWAEVFEPTGQKWISLDPACEVNMEVVGKAGKSRIEPSLQDKLNTLVYALAFNPDGSVVDVTRRYSSAYNSRTLTTRLTKYMAGSIWWNNLLGLYRPSPSAVLWHEEEFLRSRVLAEGFPKNIQAFKNHPRYVLERHLRQDEVLKAKNPVGIMSVSKAKSENVFPRSDVQQVKSANKWYQIGRVIRPGQVCKKRKKLAKSRFRLDDEEDAPLYSFEQTEAYVPQPVVDGKIPRNGYGNVDLFKPSMMPPGGAHVSGKGAYMAARSLGIDFANCVVGFDFTKGRQIKPRVDGVVVAEEYAKDVADVWRDMQEQTLAKEERNREVRALLRWRRYLTALKIRHRLDQEHGEVEEEVSDDEEEDDMEVKKEEVKKEEVKEEKEEVSIFPGEEIIDLDHESSEPWYVNPLVLQPYLDRYLNRSAFSSKKVDVVLGADSGDVGDGLSVNKTGTQETETRERAKGTDTKETRETGSMEPETSDTKKEDASPTLDQKEENRSSRESSASSSSSNENPLSELSDVIKTPVKIDFASLAAADSDSPDEMSESELYSD